VAGWRTDQVGVIPTQPSSAGVGAGAELGNILKIDQAIAVLS